MAASHLTTGAISRATTSPHSWKYTKAPSRCGRHVVLTGQPRVRRYEGKKGWAPWCPSLSTGTSRRPLCGVAGLFWPMTGGRDASRDPTQGRVRYPGGPGPRHRGGGPVAPPYPAPDVRGERTSAMGIVAVNEEDVPARHTAAGVADEARELAPALDRGLGVASRGRRRRGGCHARGPSHRLAGSSAVNQPLAVIHGCEPPMLRGSPGREARAGFGCRIVPHVFPTAR